MPTRKVEARKYKLNDGKVFVKNEDNFNYMQLDFYPNFLSLNFSLLFKTIIQRYVDKNQGNFNRTDYATYRSSHCI